MFKKNKTILTTGPYMRRFFTVDEAVELVITSLKNINLLNGKILSKEMKSSRMIDILKKYGRNYMVESILLKMREKVIGLMNI